MHALGEYQTEPIAILWNLLKEPYDLLREIPSSRFNPKGFYHPNGDYHGSTNVTHSYLLDEDPCLFDHSFFNIHPKEADIEAAGFSMQRTARSIMANRVSYFFDWRGPSVTIDTACSSSLVALHQAVQSLRSGECALAVVAGSKLHMLSPTGRSRMWDAQADGAAAQADLIRSTYERCGLDYTKPEQRCQYFEAHGTGTLAGDPIEAKAIRDVFFPAETAAVFDDQQVLFVGSVKTVIGHLEASLALQHGLIPANMHFQRLNPAIEPYYKHLVVPTEIQPWPAVPGGGPRRASVNSFGWVGMDPVPQDPPMACALNAAIASFSASTLDQLCQRLVDTASPRVVRAVNVTERRPWPLMGATLYARSRQFQETIQALDASLASLSDPPDWTLASQLQPTADPSRVHEAVIALVDLLRSSGISFGAVLGHSVAYYRGAHAHLACGRDGQPGQMMAVGMGLSDAQSFCQNERLRGRVAVAASNSRSTKQLLDDEKRFARLLKRCATAYLESLRRCRIQVQPGREDCYCIDDSDTLWGPYWVSNMVQTVLFSQALERAITEEDSFDLGPATDSIKTLTGRGEDDFMTFSDALGFIWKHFLSSRPVVDFAGFRAACVRPHAPQPLWKESWRSREYRTPSTHGDRRDMRWRHVIRLQEMDWLRGHEFQGQILFPAAGYASVQLVELMDLQIRRAITLEEDSSGVDVTFIIRRVASSNNALTVDVTESEKTNFTGRALITLGRPSSDCLPPRTPPQLPLTPLEPARLYASLQGIGLRYSGLFLVDSVRRRLNVATVTMPRQEASPWRVHPATLDAAFHGLRLWTHYLPTSIQRVVVGLVICGDVDIFCAADGHPEIQVQAITCSSFANVSPQDDRLLLSHTVWQPDISTAVVSVGHTAASPRDLQLVDLCERASFFYLRQLRAAIAPEEIPAMEWHFRCVMDWTRDHLLPMVETGRHSRVRPEWASDTAEDILAWKRTHPGQIDLEIIIAVGQALPAIVRGEIPILQVMMENDMLNRLYKSGLGFDLANERLRTMVAQISHRYPRLHVLEIGAGTGGATVNVLQGLSSQFLSYTYTDISPGFFEKAKSLFHEHRGKMRFKTLDIERDPEPQGFSPSSFDLVIASNVLHATKSLAVTMRHCRQLLKPGGYLLLLEITSDTLRPQFVMSGLSGWWLGRDDGRPWHPTITEAQWNVLLEESGFSGVDTVCRDFEEPDKCMCSVMSSQAVDDRISALRLPLAYPDTIPRFCHLLLVGGQRTLESTRIVQRLRQILRPFTHRVTLVEELERLSRSNVPPGSAVLCLAELDQPTFRDMTEPRFRGMQTLFAQANVGTLAASSYTVLALSPSNRSLVRVSKADVFPLSGSAPDDVKLHCLMRRMLVELILEGESSTDGTLWVHGADEHIAPLLAATAKARGIDLFMSTSSPTCSQQTYIHPYNTDRDIGRIKPVYVQTLVHLDPQRHPGLDDQLRLAAHNDGANVREVPVYLNSSSLGVPLDWATLRAATGRLSAGLPAPVSLATLVRDAVEFAGLQVIDWTGSSTVPVPIQPLNARGLFADRKTYFLVGLTGELGLSLCHWMAQCGARHLAIASRHPQHAGVQVRVFSLDIADRASLRGVYEEIQATMPPVAGVANAAMVLRDRSFDNMTWADFEVVLRPKVQGSENLDELFSDAPLDFFILFSSLACVIGNRGQANYGAANMFMASLAAQRRHRGLAASILDIGMLLGVGYVARTGEQYEAQLKRYRYMSLSEPDFHHMLAEAILAGHPDSNHHPTLITGLERTNLSREEATAPWHRNPRFAHYTYDDQEGGNDQQGHAGELNKLQDAALQSLRTQLSFATDHDQALRLILQVSGESMDRARPLMELGIDSLVAVEIRSWFLKELTVDIPVLRVLSGASLADICKDAILPPNHASSADSETGSNSDTVGTPAETDSKTSRDDGEEGPSQYERTGELTHAQARLYFPSVFLQDKSTYNVAFAGTVHGSLDIGRLEAALHLVAHTQETLRSSFFVAPGNTTPMQGVNSESGIVLEHRKIADESEVDAELKALRKHEFDLEQGQLLKVVVLTPPDSRHRILFCYHHIALDGLAPAPQQVIDMAVKERKERAPNRYVGCLLEPLPLFPCARVTSRQTLTAYDTETFDLRLDRQLAQLVRTRSSELQMTSFHFYLAALAAFITQALAVDDFSIGIMDANRVDPLDLQTLGFPQPQQPFTTLARQTRDQVLAALANSRVPFDLLLEHLQVPRSAHHSPLFQVALNYRMGGSYNTPLGEARIEWTHVLAPGNPYDLTVDITETPEDVTLVSFTTHRYLYGAPESQQLMQSYQALLLQLVADPSMALSQCALQPSVLIDPPRAVHHGPPLAVAWPDTIVHRVEDMCATHADSTAIIDGSGRTLTYAQMARRVTELCHALERLSMPRNSYVAMLLQPGPEMVCTLLAVIRLNHIYVPLDLRNPPERLSAIVSDCQPAVIIVDAATEQARHLASSGIPVVDLAQFETSGLAETPIPNGALDNAPAFALYTSGSTGQPKGALLTHAGLYDVHREVVLQQSSLGFDMSLEQIFIALANGGTVVIVPQEARGDPARLAELMLTHSVTYTEFVPSEFLALLNYTAATLRRCVSWRLAFSGGEKISPQLRRALRRLQLPGLQLINVYGPTEVTLSYGEDDTCVGEILPNYSVAILDASLQSVSPGAPGEICIGGVGVAVEYINKPDETARRFVPDPFDATQDGTLHFLGRLDGDRQTKTILAQAPSALLDAALSVRGAGQTLVAFVVFVPESALRRRLPLPSYMRPACLIPMDHRAIDQLPISAGWSLTPDLSLVALDEKEELVRRAWEEVLSPSYTAHAPAGGNSLLLLRLQAVLGTTYGTSLSLPELFRASTLRGMAQCLSSSTTSPSPLTGSSPIDWDLEIGSLCDALPSMVSPYRPATPDDQLIVILTGATGFLGRHLLQRLVNHPRVHQVHCIAIRSNDGDQPRPLAIRSPKIITHQGDLRGRGLGLAAATLATLANTAHLIIHNGAEVSFLKTYATLRPANVLSVRALVELALPRSIPIHFISTASVAHFVPGNGLDTPLDETSVADYPPPNDGFDGYAASKWVSESLLERVSLERRLPVCIHRPTSLIGVGAPVTDLMSNLMHYSSLIKAVPELDEGTVAGALDLVAVEDVAMEIVQIAVDEGLQESGSPVSFVHHCNKVKIPPSRLREHLESLNRGASFETRPVDVWIELARAKGLLPLVADYLSSTLGTGQRVRLPVVRRG
ncbi:hypothetical protein BDW68DRAFT_196004 [Aspergillus falconensis]